MGDRGRGVTGESPWADLVDLADLRDAVADLAADLVQMHHDTAIELGSWPTARRVVTLAGLWPDEGDDDRPAGCCGRCPPVAGGGYDCTCAGNPRCAGGDDD